MSEKPQTLTAAISICLAMSQRCLAEVRALARLPGPQGPQGATGRGEKGEPGEKGEAGQPGQDAAQLKIRGTYNEDAAYRYFDVVMTGGSSFVALSDNPGACPGAGWQLIASAGRQGRPGLKGDRGDPGNKGDPGKALTIVRWTIDRESFCAIPILSDGSEAPALELRGLFEQYQMETH